MERFMYRKIFIFVVLLTATTLYGQFNMPNKSNVTGGLGMVWIDGQPNYAFRLSPDFSFGNFGFGLDLNLEFDATGSLRNENFNTATDYLSIIRYLRYGQKNDPVFIKLGAIDYYTLGHGSIMYLYNNRPSLDNKKIGIGFDLNMDKWGFESIYSDFSQSGILGIRGHLKPLKYALSTDIPILSNIEVGATYVSDMNENARVDSFDYDAVAKNITKRYGTKSLTEYGFDIGLPLYSSSIFNTTLYFDYAKIQDFGAGKSAGIIMNLNAGSFVTLGARLERRWNEEHYIPSYFNWMYEINRFQYDPATQGLLSSYKSLSTVNSDNGNFGSLKMEVLNLLKVYGSYERLDKTPESGVLDIKAEVSTDKMPVVARAGYTKTNITNEGAMFTTDDHSYLYSELGYKPYPYLLVSMFYIWTFEPVRDADKNVIGYAPQKRVEPRISFIYPF